MNNVAGIIGFVDRYLESTGRDYLNASEAAILLAEAGVITGDDIEAGDKLVNILGRGLIPHAFRENGEWRIPASGGDVAQCRID